MSNTENEQITEVGQDGPGADEVGPLAEGGTTTRDDRNDLGVPMLEGSPDEPQGPEDALGEGPTRGDYRDRIGPPHYHPHEGNVSQRERAENIGDVPGKKGGVETTEDDKPRRARKSEKS